MLRRIQGALLMKAAFLVQNHVWEPNDLDKRTSILQSELTALGTAEDRAATGAHADGTDEDG